MVVFSVDAERGQKKPVNGPFVLWGMFDPVIARISG
jgi:hypothetical protein